MIPESQIEEIIEKNDLADVVSEYTRLTRKGSGYMGLCPFHREKTPSFSIHEGKQIFKCFGCGKGGNVVHFIMLAEGFDYFSAIEFLASRAGIEITDKYTGSSTSKLRQDIMSLNKEAARFFFKCLAKDAGAQQYCINRGFDIKTIKTFGIGYAPDTGSALKDYLLKMGITEKLMLDAGLVIKGKDNNTYDKFRKRLMFPIFDVLGNVIAFGGRVMDNSMPKYLNSPETALYTKGKHLYALNFARKSESKRVFMVEGYMDCIALHQRGITYAVASLGTALTDNQAKLLKKYFDEVIISYDADSAGQKATIRGLEVLQKTGFRIKVLSIPDGKDPDDYLKRHSPEEFLKLADNAKTMIEYQVGKIQERWSPKKFDTRIEFVKEVTALLAKIENRVERDMYINWVSREYEIPEESLSLQIEDVGKGFEENLYVIKRGNIKESENNTAPKTESKRDMQEKMLILLLSEDMRVLQKLREQIAKDYFTDKNKILYENLLRRCDSGLKAGTESVLMDADVADASIISQILTTWLTPPDILEACREIMGRIRKIKLDDRIEEIYAILRQNKIDDETRDRLKIEITNILKEKRA